MAITSSTYTASNLRSDSRMEVVESHTDSYGKVYSFEYLAPAGWNDTDFTARMSSRSAEIESMLAEQEIEEVLRGT